MKIFFLKKTGFNTPVARGLLILTMTFILSHVYYHFFPDIIVVIFGLGANVMISMLLINLFIYILKFLRINFPYQKIKFIENNKEYIIHDFQYTNIKKYYHKNKLHRETEAAIIYTEDPSVNAWYLNGVEFHQNDIQKEIVKNKVSTF